MIAILCADTHLRPDFPIGRIDNYTEAMFNKLSFVLKLSKEHNCPILVAGDFGNKPSSQGWPPWLLEQTISLIKESSAGRLICIPGQHDIIDHQISKWKQSGIGVLSSSRVIDLIGIKKNEDPYNLNNTTIYGFGYGIDIQHREKTKKFNVAMTHQMIINDKELWPGQEAPKGHQLLEKFPSYDLILCGDNHQPFVCEKEGRFLVNPGSMMRSTTAQQNHKPRVYLWDAEEKKVEPVYLPIEDNVWDLQHIERQSHDKGKEERFESLINHIQKGVELELFFEKNIQNYLDNNRTEKSVIDKIWANVK